MHKSALILTEAGEGIGYGHYTRCLAVFHYLCEISSSKMLLSVNNDFVPESGVELLDWVTSREKIRAFAQEYPVVLVDSYLADGDFYSFLSKHFSKVVVIDDYNRLEYDADLVINPNIFGDELNYTGRARVAGGTNFVILRKEFLEGNRVYSVNKNIGNILLTVGGSDYRGLLPPLISHFLEKDLSVAVLSGNDHYATSLRAEFGSENIRIYGFLSAGEMKDLMLVSDVAVSACGQTLHELTYMGVPYVGICIDKDQVPNMKKYYSLGILPCQILWTTTDLIGQVDHCFQKLIPYSKRKEVSEKARRLLKGKGVQNIAKLVLE